MKTYPLESISIPQAAQKQFRMVDCVMRHFEGYQLLSRGDLGVHQPENQPETTRRAEMAIADFFEAEDAILVLGSGTGAIRYGLSALAKAGDKILIHDAPVYSTTQTSLDMLGLVCVRADYNDIQQLRQTLRENRDIRAALVQVSRQKIEDSYDLSEVIRTIKDETEIPVLTDDNYAVMKIQKTGVECGSDLSTFSAFKLQGPEGVGVVTGKKKYIDIIRKMHYSGGCQVQGWQAMEVLRGLIIAPVMLAVQAEEIEKILTRLENKEIQGIAGACIANAQSKVLLVEFEEPVAQKVLENAEKLGALPHPVGSESKYEMAPLFYRVSGTFLKTDPTLKDRMIRINPNRAGADTVLRVLKESLEKALEK